MQDHELIMASRSTVARPGVYNRWTGLVDWTGGLDWTGLDWTGLEWTGLKVSETILQLLESGCLLI